MNTNSQNFDEKGILKDIKAPELCVEITKLTRNWNNHSDPIKEAHELMNKVRKLSLEISEYEQRMGSKLSEYQSKKIHNSIIELGELIPRMKNKIKPNESLEKILRIK